MSKEAVIQLIESAESDNELRNKLSSASGAESVITIASARGYQFTESELLEVMQEKQLSFAEDDELSEEQLEAVVGGKDHKTKTFHKADQYHKTTGS